MPTVVIKLAGSEITQDCDVARTRFTAKVNGAIGDAEVWIRDDAHTYRPIAGQRLTLEINGSLRWSGFALLIGEEYAFPVEDTTGGKEATAARYWVLSGADDNILFDKRFVFDADNPATHIDFQYLPGTYDDTIIKDVVEHYLDLSGDNITTEGVKRVRNAILDLAGLIGQKGSFAKNSDHEGTVYTGSVASAGFTWKQMMDLVQRATGGIYYLDGVSRTDRRILRYHDVETVTSDYALTDTPDTAIALGDPDPNDSVAGDNFQNRDITPVTGSGTLDSRWGTSSQGIAYTTQWDALIGVVDGLGTIEIEAEPGFSQGNVRVREPIDGKTLAFNFKLSAIPSDPGPQIDSAHDDIGWRTVADLEIRMAHQWVAVLSIGSYAPPAYSDASPIDDEDNPGIMLYSNGGTDGDVFLPKTDWLADTFYSLKLEYDPDNGIHRIKIWEATDPEPGTWLLERDPTGEASYSDPPATNDYEVSNYYYIDYWDYGGADTAVFSYDNFDPGLTLPVPGTPIPIENPVTNHSFESDLDDWSHSGATPGPVTYPTSPFPLGVVEYVAASAIGFAQWGFMDIGYVIVKRPGVFLAEGDLLIASVMTNGGDPHTITPAAGWELVEEYIDPLDLAHYDIFKLRITTDIAGWVGSDWHFNVSGAHRGGNAITADFRNATGVVMIGPRDDRRLETPLGEVDAPGLTLITEAVPVALFQSAAYSSPSTWGEAAGLEEEFDQQEFYMQQSMQVRGAGAAGEVISTYTATMDSPDAGSQIRHGRLMLVEGNPAAHAGDVSVRLESTPDNPAEAAQTFVLPEGADTLSVWYRGYCVAGSDGFQIDLENLSTSTTSTVLGPVCSTVTDWTEATIDVSGMGGDVVRLHLYALPGAEGSITPPSTPLDDAFGRTETGQLGDSWELISQSNPGVESVDGSTAVMSAHEWSYWKNTDVPAPTPEFDIYADFKTEPIGDGTQDWGGYAYFEYGDLWWDVYSNYPTTDPWDFEFSMPGVGGGFQTDYMSLELDTWYHTRARRDADGLHLKVWKVGDAEPGSWFMEGDYYTGTSSDFFAMEMDGGMLTPTLVDNVRVELGEQPAPDPTGHTVAWYDLITVSGTTPAPLYPPTPLNRLNYEGDDPANPIAKGYRQLRITENGQDLVTDMQVWGAALGAKLMVHSRIEDAAALALHGRWQEGILSVGIYRQASADLVASSWVNGTPQSHRGHKNDKVSVTCTTLMSVFKVGEVVAFKSSIWDFQQALPIRQMTIAFRAPWIPWFVLTLSHEIDQPWSFYEELRKKDRPKEVKQFHWTFPIPFVRLCPVPTLAEATVPGVGEMRSIFQQDFLGEDVNDDDLPLWQITPFGGAWFTGYSNAARPKSLTDTIPLGAHGRVANALAINPSAAMELRTPASGAIEILAAFQFKSPSNGAYAIGFPGGPDAWATPSAVITVTAGIPVLQFYASMEGRQQDNGLVDPWGIGPTSAPGVTTSVDLPASYLRQPLWIRIVIAPNEGGDGGWFAKVWPRRRLEPDDWSLAITTGDVPVGDTFTVGSQVIEVIGPWFDVIDGVGPDINNGNQIPGAGVEAMAVYAEHGGDFPLHWTLFLAADATGADGYFSPVPADGPPGTWSPDFGGNYNQVYGFYFWGPEAGSFSEDRFQSGHPDSINDFATDTPQHSLLFVWPHFYFDPWDPVILFLAQVQQKIVSYKMGFTSMGRIFNKNPDNTDADPGDPPIGFVQKLPDMVRIKGEVYVAPDSGGLFPSTAGPPFGAWPPNLPWEVLLSFNYYGFGDGTATWAGGPYEADPVARHYVNYNPASGLGITADDGTYWMPFEFDIPVEDGGYEAGDYLQWGCTFVGDMEQTWRDGLPVGTYGPSNIYPPGRFFLPNQSGVGLVFRNVQYLANYLTDEVGEYFCVQKPVRAVLGNAIGHPINDSGDHLTYDIGTIFVPGSTSIWVNGVAQMRGATEDYTESPGTGQIIFNAARDPDDEVVADFAGLEALLP